MIWLCLWLLAATACGSAPTAVKPAAVTPASDDWPLATPESQQLDGAKLAAVAQRIEAGAYGQIDALLVVRHGRLVLERYFNGWVADRPHPVYSVTKSVTAALAGLACGRGGLSGPEQRLRDLLPQYAAQFARDSLESLITLGHVLTMTAGFEWDEGSTPYGDPQNSATQMAGSPDWMRFVLDRPMVTAPGERFRYNSGCSVLLSGVLERATGLHAAEFARQVLFAPLGIAESRWESGPARLTNTGWGLSLAPRDMARVGELHLRGGMWRGRRVLPADWVAQSLARQFTLRSGFEYGYQWWRVPAAFQPSSGTPLAEVIMAWGYGDQFIFLIPRFDMVVVTAGSNYRNFRQEREDPVVFVRRDVLRAVRDTAAAAPAGGR